MSAFNGNKFVARLDNAIRQDPKKSGFLALVSVVFIVMVARAIVAGSGGVAHANGSIANNAIAGRSTPDNRGGSTGSQNANRGGSRPISDAELRVAMSGLPPLTLPGDPKRVMQKLRDWMSKPVPPVSRNLFSTNLDFFPRDGSRKGEPGTNNAVADGSFWSNLEKSLLVQADLKDKRDTLQANYEAEAGKLRLDSIVMGQTPKAMIDGKLVSEGDVVALFAVQRIEARRIIVERDGFRFEITMR